MPIYVIIENFKSGGQGRSGRRPHKEDDEGEKYPGQPGRRNRLAGFLREYGRSYEAEGGKDR